MSDKKVTKRTTEDVVSKTASKRKQNEVQESIAEELSPSEKRKEWLKEKAKTVKIPEEDAAVIKPGHIFLEQGPLIIHLCSECKKFNAQRPATIVGEGRVELPMAMCAICRHHFNRQRSVRFFEHELAAIKRDMDL
ncbi:hypothetical protein CAEBREN_25579 [Caenorhabditis brenneri]|uniref:Uncharacterized protein n=1 Tax=Caenorhabditis brenneri TaxID=135651 RepID=G0PD27_CAEBE|nr:hypothetical protein CAEBREN_25579 [Caenorhabditis brenneri]